MDKVTFNNGEVVKLCHRTFQIRIVNGVNYIDGAYCIKDQCTLYLNNQCADISNQR